MRVTTDQQNTMEWARSTGALQEFWLLVLQDESDGNTPHHNLSQQYPHEQHFALVEKLILRFYQLTKS